MARRRRIHDQPSLNLNNLLQNRTKHHLRLELYLLTHHAYGSRRNRLLQFEQRHLYASQQRQLLERDIGSLGN